MQLSVVLLAVLAFSQVSNAAPGNSSQVVNVEGHEPTSGDEEGLNQVEEQVTENFQGGQSFEKGILSSEVAEIKRKQSENAIATTDQETKQNNQALIGDFEYIKNPSQINQDQITESAGQVILYVPPKSLSSWAFENLSEAGKIIAETFSFCLERILLWNNSHPRTLQNHEELEMDEFFEDWLIPSPSCYENGMNKGSLTIASRFQTYSHLLAAFKRGYILVAQKANDFLVFLPTGNLDALGLKVPTLNTQALLVHVQVNLPQSVNGVTTGLKQVINGIRNWNIWTLDYWQTLSTFSSKAPELICFQSNLPQSLNEADASLKQLMKGFSQENIQNSFLQLFFAKTRQLGQSSNIKLDHLEKNCPVKLPQVNQVIYISEIKLPFNINQNEFRKYYKTISKPRKLNSGTNPGNKNQENNNSEQNNTSEQNNPTDSKNSNANANQNENQPGSTNSNSQGNSSQSNNSGSNKPSQGSVSKSTSPLAKTSAQPTSTVGNNDETDDDDDDDDDDEMDLEFDFHSGAMKLSITLSLMIATAAFFIFNF